MRHKRAKTYRKLMTMYQSSFGFHQPYQVLADASFCTDGTRTKLLKSQDATKVVGDIVQGSCKIMITQCCITELYKLGSAEQTSVDLAKSFERRKCNHRQLIPGDECMIAVIGSSNKHRYVVASQSTELRNKLRDIPAVPLIHINRSVLVLEPPSKVTLDQKEAAEEIALQPAATEVPELPSVQQQQSRKQRGPKGPNPLSVKKKKPTQPLPRVLKSLDSEHPYSTPKRKWTEGEGGLETEEKDNVIDGDRPKKKRRRKKPTEGNAIAEATGGGDLD